MGSLPLSKPSMGTFAISPGQPACIYKRKKNNFEKRPGVCLCGGNFPPPVLYFGRDGKYPRGQKTLKSLPRRSWNVVFRVSSLGVRSS